jgi:hypothetical protein
MLVLLLFVGYSCVGMSMFGRVARGVRITDNNSTVLIYDPDAAINEHANFSTFFQSFALLFRCATGEDWQVVMKDLMLDPALGECDESPDDGHGSTCGSAFASFYMISFVLSGSFIVLNLFVAVIVDNFEFLTQDDAELSAESLDVFLEAWAKYDPTNKGFINLTEVQTLLSEVEPPFGLKGCPSFIINSKLAQVQCPVRYKVNSNLFEPVTGRRIVGANSFVVEFRPLFMALVRLQKGGGDEANGGGWKDIDDRELRAIICEFVHNDPMLVREALPGYKQRSHTDFETIKSVRHYYSIVKIQLWWRNQTKKRKMARETAKNNRMIIRYSSRFDPTHPQCSKHIHGADLSSSIDSMKSNVARNMGISSPTTGIRMGLARDSGGQSKTGTWPADAKCGSVTRYIALAHGCSRKAAVMDIDVENESDSDFELEC